jgi:hypothetical protein
MPMCPQCWARRRAVSVWKKLYTTLRVFQPGQVRLIWARGKWQIRRTEYGSVYDVRKLRQWCQEQAHKRFEFGVAIEELGLVQLGNLLLTRVYPSPPAWRLDYTSLALVQNTRQLQTQIRSGKMRGWYAHDDWSNAGLGRLLSLTYQYPYDWLSADGQDWKAFTEHWKRLRAFDASGVFRGSLENRLSCLRRED